MPTAKPDRLVSESLREIADELSTKLEQVAGQPMSFSLVVFNAVAGSRMNYISNCRRDDAHAALKSLITGWEQGMPDIPAHKVE